jgi:Mrp family chromosome partitioning ATPase/capsular polysaccharide biosynthesis protein
MTSTATQSPPTTVESVLNLARVARRRLWIVLPAVLLVPIVAYAFASQQPAAYKATSSALLNHLNLAASLTGLPQDPTASTAPDRALDTQSALARTPTVVDSVIKATKSRLTTDEFLSISSVTPRPSTDIIDVSVVAHDPQVARTLSTAYIRAFVEYSNGLERATLDQGYTDVTTRLASLRAKHLTNTTLYNTLQDRQQQIVALQTLQTPTLQVVKVPTGTTQVAPRAKRAAAVGLLGGILLAIALSLIIEAIDTRIREVDEIETLLGLPLLARVPPAVRDEKGAGGTLLGTPDGPQAEAFRLLRTNLSFLQLGTGFKTLLVTSPDSGDGKTTTVASLGAAFARSGANVIVCDLDARKPDLAGALGKADAIGLTEVALGRATLQEALQPISLGPLPLALQLEEARSRPRARVVDGASSTSSGQTPGRLLLLGFGKLRPPLPGEFVGSEVVRQIVARLRQDADLVIIDSAPMLRVGDSLSVSGNVDAALIVVRSTTAGRDELTELRRLLAASPVNALGAVATDARLRQSDYGYYGYGHAHAPRARSAHGS